jgi:23S rRNA pseudouridine1911/1915/1917 synthase
VRHAVSAPQTLADVLKSLFPDSSGRKLKQILEHGRVSVDGQVVKVGRTSLRTGAVVEVGEARRVAVLPEGVAIVYQDEHLLVAEKGAGLLTIATAKEREHTLYRYLSSHVKEKDPGAKVFIVHRLDRDASGLLVFARTVEVKTALQAQLREHTVDRLYCAIVEGRVETEEGTIDRPLVELETGRVEEGKGGRGREARTHYRVLRAGDKHSRLEVRLESGRKHQIRVHLAILGHPIAGDKTYGARGEWHRLALHARTLAFDHPVTGERMRFESPVPQSLGRLK